MTAQNDLADVYRHTFAPRLDAYADWDAANDHWIAVRQELTIERVIRGLTEARPVSAYMSDREGRTHVGAIDFDRDDGWSLGIRTARVICDQGGFAVVERSRRGCHLWLIVDAVLSGDIMRKALRSWLAKVDAKASQDPKCEIMPKVVQRGPDTLGFALRMPMMAHQRTGERHNLCDPDGRPIGRTVGEVLIGFEMTPRALVEKAADSAPPVIVPLGTVGGGWRPPQPPRTGEVPAASQLLISRWGVMNARPGRTVRCPVHPSPDRHPSLSIMRDDERVFCHDPECEWHGGGRGVGSIELARLAEGPRA